MATQPRDTSWPGYYYYYYYYYYYLTVYYYYYYYSLIMVGITRSKVIF